MDDRQLNRDERQADRNFRTKINGDISRLSTLATVGIVIGVIAIIVIIILIIVVVLKKNK